MIQNLTFVILFWKYYFDTFHTWTSSAFFIPEFVAENLKANKNQGKRSLILQYSFAQKNLTHFTNLISFEIENNMLPKHSQKTFLVYKLSSKHVSVWCQKKNLHCTISWRPRTTFLKHFASKSLYIYVYLSKKIFVWKK